MARGLDYEKDRRQQKAKGRRRPSGKKRRAHDRQMAMAYFVKRHKIECFKCKKDQVYEWAKTGTSKAHGPWAICVECLKR